LPEAGLVAPGDVIIGGDSHTCTYGALNAFGTGVGQTDIGASMATGNTWFKVPPTLKVELIGRLPPYVKGKDVILTLIGMIGVDGARYQSLEFSGDLAQLSVDDRLTICNMAIEAGGKAGIFPFDAITEKYLKGRTTRLYEPVAPDGDAVFARTVTIDLSRLEPAVACPHLPENVKPAVQLKQTRIDQVIVGSCTNGRLSDLAQAAEIIRGRKIHDNVRMIVLPATQAIYLEAMERGYIKDFIEAGAAVSTPTCGPCLGGHMGILAAGERAVSTTNRNFRGRMGHVDSEVYLAGPYVAAASAVLGRIAHPAEI
ncbi:MAG: 3-isopropylmalate dehydratase large subunit, partial [Acidaminococcales bacterium]|jgi:3-isopropylmalate/(R)-2-methylmalate dehydratase large subunit|nr:3-isopropylmalate dehydratase large subunit [Acidaminococcales bacterium]